MPEEIVKTGCFGLFDFGLSTCSFGLFALRLFNEHVGRVEECGTKPECPLFSARSHQRFSSYSRLPGNRNSKLENWQLENRKWKLQILERGTKPECPLFSVGSGLRLWSYSRLLEKRKSNWKIEAQNWKLEIGKWKMGGTRNTERSWNVLCFLQFHVSSSSS